MSNETVPKELLDAVQCWLKETFDWAEIIEDQYGLQVFIKTGNPNPMGSDTDVLIQLTRSPRPNSNQPRWLRTRYYENNGIKLSVSCPYGNKEYWTFHPDEKAGGMRLEMGALNDGKECAVADPEFFFDVLTSIIQTSMLISMGKVQPAFYKTRIHESQWAKDLREYMNDEDQD